MQIFKQLFWIFFFTFLGEVFSLLLKPLVMIPGSVLGMLSLFFALHFQWIKKDQVSQVGNWLSANMGIFFVPAAAAIMLDFEVLKDAWWQFLLIILVTLILTLIIVGRMVQWLIQRKTIKEDE